MDHQKEVWQSNFGEEYTERNIFSPEELNAFYVKEYGVSRIDMNNEFLSGLNKDIRILEVGCNVGNQLRLLQQMGFTNLYGLELQPYAVQRAKDLTKGINIIQGVADDLPFKDSYFDLVFTSGVLIHIPPELHEKVMTEMYRCTKKYLWGFEYFSDTLSEINYRGNTNLLWKSDFSQEFQKFTKAKEIKRCTYKYVNSDNVDMMYLLER